MVVYTKVTVEKCMLTERQRRSLAISFRLPPVMAKVFEVLLTSPVATNQMIEACVNGDGTPAKLVIYRLRSLLKYTTIKIHKRNMVGYWFDEGTKHYIMQTINDNTKYLVAAE